MPLSYEKKLNTQIYDFIVCKKNKNKAKVAKNRLI